MTNRTWSARIEIREGGRLPQLLDVQWSESDLLLEQTRLAVRLATRFLRDSRQVFVILYKTTKARGTERDRSYVVYRDDRGQVRYQ